MSEEMARTEAIEVLKDIVSKPMLYSNHIIGACRVALASLETDEAYQLEYERTTKNDLGVDAVSRQAVIDTIFEECSGAKLDIDFAKVLMLQRAIKALPSVTPQEPISDKIQKMKSEIADSLEFWDYSPNNNPLARDMLETLTNFLADMRKVEE